MTDDYENPYLNAYSESASPNQKACGRAILEGFIVGVFLAPCVVFFVVSSMERGIGWHVSITISPAIWLSVLRNHIPSNILNVLSLAALSEFPIVGMAVRYYAIRNRKKLTVIIVMLLIIHGISGLSSFYFAHPWTD